MTIRSAATTCQTILSPSYSPPTVSSGWTASLAASGLSKPRTIVFDESGALLVLENGVGIKRITFTNQSDSCLTAETAVVIVNETSLNHGLVLSNDGTTIYASNASSVLAWPYNSSSGSVTGLSTTVVSGMTSDNQVTRTLLVSQLEPDMLIVSRGSDERYEAVSQSSGLGQIKAFNLTELLTSADSFDFDSTGRLLGWGLFNAVGIGEHPLTGGIFAMDNGADDMTRDGSDIHQSNPGDELNFHGFLNGTTSISGAEEQQGANYGYPDCAAAWNTTIPDSPVDFQVGEQFSVGNSTVNDTICQTEFVAPKLTFKPHQTPLDILFSADGAGAYISFHGSTDETNPVGYLVGQVTFDPVTGQPTESSDSTTALSDIIRNSDDADCPSSCMRPVGLAVDRQGRLYFSSDTTGEIYVLVNSTSTGSQGGQEDGLTGHNLSNEVHGDSADRKVDGIPLTDRGSWGNQQEHKKNVFRDEVQRQEQQRVYS
ncbi:soluble quino protein glucose dehydrogenase [Cryphonectria parasitica EP155]|uniref:Soluble quino protein glucose dehydrogenase n=1 Tax=Cryphonectria parasitica (strain ATCC 38755 / EP155) TaxID=660469 RepID=A0A9P5CI68_CRYP1|nr:soluble quino protein glucose dehydrogenase [Cryphonectria parasitica EP155]KAF3760368.1 soluble quino protein glucose dehydrogenase [Cryphonectria parasitica EP155]